MSIQWTPFYNREEYPGSSNVIGVLLGLLLPDERTFRGTLCLDERLRLTQSVEEQTDGFAFEIVFLEPRGGPVKGALNLDCLLSTSGMIWERLGMYQS